jgi:hypothetical protein
MRLRLEPRIAPGTLAGRAREICQKIILALALARGARHRFGRRGAPRPAPFAVTPALLPPLLLSVGGRSIALGRTPAPPDPRGLPAGGAAIPVERVRWLEVRPAPLQQTNARIPAGGTWIDRPGGRILRWAHGSGCSHRSSRGGELPLAAAAFCWAPRLQSSDDRSADPGNTGRDHGGGVDSGGSSARPPKRYLAAIRDDK